MSENTHDVLMRVLLAIGGIIAIAIGAAIAWLAIDYLLAYDYANSSVLITSIIFVVITLSFGLSMIYAAITEGGPFVLFVELIYDIFDDYS